MCWRLRAQVYAVDLLGQGQSWPSNPQCEVSGPLRLSADTWTEQLHHFIQVRPAARYSSAVWCYEPSLTEVPLARWQQHNVEVPRSAVMRQEAHALEQQHMRQHQRSVQVAVAGVVS